MNNKELIAEARGIRNWAQHETGPEGVGARQVGPTLFARLVYALEAAEPRGSNQPEGINESNWGTFAAVVLEAESAHWQAEYDQLTNRYGAYRATKSRAAWKLGATMLLRRAERYREDDVRIAATTEATK